MKTESRYKEKLITESCFHLHKILDSVIILEHTQYTPSVYVKILNTIIPSTDIVPLSAANQEEVDAATYIDVTAV